tara:strand:+ start:664 stop:1212 length:549 start_codon:yes stop_codon:yes gene_type:complete
MPLSKIVANSITTNAVGADALSSSAITNTDLPAGTVLQVVKSAIRTNANDTTSATYAEISSDYRVTITPKAADSVMIIDFTFGISVDGGTKLAVITKVGTNSDFSTGMDSVHSQSHNELFRSDVDNNRRIQARSFLRSYYDDYSSTATLYFRQDYKRTSGSGTARVNDNTGPAFVTVTEIQQ